MRGISMPWGLSGALLALSYFHSICASASPSINIGLKASFTSAPYLLELLETAADENVTSYFPLLDRIAEGHFSKATTEKALYELFLETLKEDGHMADPETLATYKFALSARSSAPRIEAHYQYYHTAAETSLNVEPESSCQIWVLFNEKQYCSPDLDTAHGLVSGGPQTQHLEFDRVLGNTSAPASVLYADITSPTFGQFHKTLSRTAREGKTSYRVRHRKSLSAKPTELVIPGYGVELALKRTDYIVIDDRQDESSKLSSIAPEKKVRFEDEEVADLKPLSTSELYTLGLSTSSFIMQSENPFETLVKLSQDFPKYSSAVATHNASENFIAEHEYNRAQLVPAGYNIWWMNGLQIIERNIEALSLLDILRRERKLINGARGLGLSGPEAVELLAHPQISKVKAANEVQRFDWRDGLEGGNVIIWMNDIEKDKRYEFWPTALTTMLQRVYPGQLPSVRRDCFNLVLPIDFTDAEGVFLVTETLQSFVKRKLAIRIGIVPITRTLEATEQARVIYHLLDTYGLSTAMTYLETSHRSRALSSPNKSKFDTAIEGRRLKLERTVQNMPDLLKSEAHTGQVDLSKLWIKRLSADSKIPPIFVNGAAIPRDESWLQSMSERITSDLQTIQQAIFQENVTEDAWLPLHFLAEAVTKRNALVVPEDEKMLKILDINKLYANHKEIFDLFPKVAVNRDSPKHNWAHMIIITDLNTDAGDALLGTATYLRELNPSVELVIVHNPSSGTSDHGLSDEIFKVASDSSHKPFSDIGDLLKILSNGKSPTTQEVRSRAERFWGKSNGFIEALSLLPGQSAILLNGRIVGPILDVPSFDGEDFEQLLSYERNKRIWPALNALDDLGLLDKIADPLASAKLSSIVATSTMSDTPEGMFDSAPTIRMSKLNEWKSTHTAIEVGDASTASIHLTVLVDPASQQGQRWIPLLKVLSELDGICLKIFLNPKDRLEDLPVKRFYRYVLDSKPKFDDSGSLIAPSASFNGVPQEALLTVGMDVPPAWLVAPKGSVHDLDNIKLSSIKTNVDALYELENILIEGHSREIPGGGAPRGTQLVLGTERDLHTADTIIMANLGYFQFKANPGYYKIGLKEGRSTEIFNIDSVGSQGWNPIPGDENTEVALMSFQGSTLYPRLSRKVGMEAEDVLESTSMSATDIVSKGLKFAQGILGGKPKSVSDQEHAEINIFSVASGHLYERMLNIMMVSVMKHTQHTVKFWFIEQFLSPSFKEFIPYLAAEYGFKYEMVTFKWPHWLRAQTEKQRQIWGYKILFLDVLFPLSLDKVIFVDADQIVRTDMMELVNHDLEGAPYGFTPMCDSRTEMEGFRFWKQGYWANFLRGLPYHISALYVVDLRKFRQIAAGDRLRQQYHALSADPNSLSNLDQDLPNHMQSVLPIHSLPQEWLWCETWCSDESLKEARTIDLCNNPMTKEPKLDRARRQVPEWTVYDEEISAVDRKRKGLNEENTKKRILEEAHETKKDEL